MATIQVMPAHLADLIAAGEVVERPGSVVKELLENAVDAKAGSITVEIQGGGMHLIRVTDDGSGMSREDVPTAFLRHATSKLQREDQLSSINTLGFRGEALAAIAAVSRIEVLTRRTQDSEGTCLTLEGGVQTELKPAGCPVGTTMIVRDLFYNTPARQKFMKRDSAEASNVLSIVQRQALANPGVSYRFIRQGTQQLHTPGDGSLQSAAYCVLGRQTALEMLSIQSGWNGITVSGLVCKPTASRGNRSYQHFFVNGRWIQSKTLTAALEQAYRSHIMTGRYPACVLHLTVPLQSVDVNVHPAKTEVRFLSDKDMFDAVYYAVLEALRTGDDRPQLDLEPSKPRAQSEKSAAAFAVPQTANSYQSELQTSASVNPRQDFYQTMSAQEYRDYLRQQPAETKGNTLQGVYEAFLNRQSAVNPLHAPIDWPLGSSERLSFSDSAAQSSASEVVQPTPTHMPEKPGQDTQQLSWQLPSLPDWRVVGEIMKTYIIVEQGSEVLLIDKHAAHERILFERYRAQESPIMAQTLLQPLRLTLDVREAEALLAAPEILSEYGYELEDFGQGMLVARQIPADLSPGLAESALQELAATILNGERADPNQLRDERLHTIACKAAIKGGDKSDPAELDLIARQVLTRDDLKHCPHGRPICIRLTQASIEKQFRRTI